MKLSSEERLVLNLALEHYIRLGLGHFSDIATRLSLLLLPGQYESEKLGELHNVLFECEKLIEPWTLRDEKVSRYTLVALLLQARLNKDKETEAWVEERLKNCTDEIK